MPTARLDASQPIEVWLTQKNIEVTRMVVVENESTYTVDVDSRSMRGAQREITSSLINSGYEPVGRWQADTPEECSRRFRPAGRS